MGVSLQAMGVSATWLSRLIDAHARERWCLACCSHNLSSHLPAITHYCGAPLVPPTSLRIRFKLINRARADLTRPVNRVVNPKNFDASQFNDRDHIAGLPTDRASVSITDKL